jgi:DNA-binding IclR family transcriptional regulator
MNQLPYQQALARIRSEYLEMPGMKLTIEQVQRLSGVDRDSCKRVLDDLVRMRFLRVGPDGHYARDTDGLSKSKRVKAALGNRSVRSNRRAG